MTPTLTSIFISYRCLLMCFYVSHARLARPNVLVGPCCSSFQFSVLCVLVLFVFVLCLMPNVTSVSGLSILDFPFVFS